MSETTPADNGSQTDTTFGEPLDASLPRLPEDCVEYALHIIDPALEPLELRKILRNVLADANALSKRHLSGYIWQRDSFALQLARDHESSCLRGKTIYGDSIEDEWLVVYILRELSIQYPRAWIRVTDTDGEFLLIEAASSLPPWVQPEVATARVLLPSLPRLIELVLLIFECQVWLNAGELAIIPPSDTLTGPLSEAQALQALASRDQKLARGGPVQAEAFHRLRNYPKQISDSNHWAMIIVPRALAYILHEEPQYISPAVEAFYLRDPIAMRPLQSRDSSKLLFDPRDCVSVAARFNRANYAQLKGQRFSTPSAWNGMPQIEDARHLKRAETGMKVSCGFEMLLSDPQNQDMRQVREIRMLLDDLDSNEAVLPTDADIARWPAREDSESWLDIDFATFDRELSGEGDHRSGDSSGFGHKTVQEDLRKMVERFQGFLKEDEQSSETASHGSSESDALDEMDESRSESQAEEDEIAGKDFTDMMRELLGMSKETMEELMKGREEENPDSSKSASTAVNPPSLSAKTQGHETRRPRRGANDDDQDDDEIRALTVAMERELRMSGALDLEIPNDKVD